MKKEGEGIAEILESGQFSNCHNFRVPQPWSRWLHPPRCTETPQRVAPSVNTIHGKDDEARPWAKGRKTFKTYA